MLHRIPLLCCRCDTEEPTVLISNRQRGPRYCTEMAERCQGSGGWESYKAKEKAQWRAFDPTRTRNRPTVMLTLPIPHTLPLVVAFINTLTPTVKPALTHAFTYALTFAVAFCNTLSITLCIATAVQETAAGWTFREMNDNSYRRPVGRLQEHY